MTDLYDEARRMFARATDYENFQDGVDTFLLRGQVNRLEHALAMIHDIASSELPYPSIPISTGARINTIVAKALDDRLKYLLKEIESKQ